MGYNRTLMSNVKYIEPAITASADYNCYIKESEAFGIPQQVTTDIPDGVSYAIEELFEIPYTLSGFSHFAKPSGCHPKNLFKAYVFCDEKIKKVIKILDDQTSDERDEQDDKEERDEEALHEALFLLKSFNEMHREIRSRMSSILGC
jgi:hypothetical protein